MALLGLCAFAALTIILWMPASYIITSWQLLRKKASRGCKDPPIYPCRASLGLGSLVELLAADRAKMLCEYVEGRVSTVCEKEGRQVDTFIVRDIGGDKIFTSNPRNVKAVLATQFKEFELGKVRRESLLPLLGSGIFNANGADWSRSRALLRPQFTREQIGQLDLEERHVQNAMQMLRVAADGWTSPTNIQSVFFNLTIDSATEFLLGKSVDSQLGSVRSSNDLGNNFAVYFDRSQRAASKRIHLGALSWIIDSKETRHSDATVHMFVDQLVNDALLRTKSQDTEQDLHGKQYVFLDALASDTKDPVELRSHVLHLLLAGRDTTASLLSWTVLRLSRHPRVLQKLRASITATFGAYPSTENISFSTLKSCQYLQHVMSEVLRLHPVVPLNRRSAISDTTIPEGGGTDGKSPIFIRKGQVIEYSPYVIHRRKDFWGHDAAEFIPERWVHRKTGWEYIPFNGGPRICIGQQFALTEAGYVLVRLLQRFDRIEDVYPERPMRGECSLTTYPADSVTVRLREAEVCECREYSQFSAEEKAEHRN